ncbi:MAG TPA: hypothetical protein GXX75_10970 [Clostridiales bacterium]|nr:hypothetical protein [Clostridiales bacterium]
MGGTVSEWRILDYNVCLASPKDSNKLPASITRTADEDDTFASNQSNIDDYLNSMILKFITGTEELNKTTWESFKTQMKALGVDENIAINQAAYERYMKR